MHTHWTGEPGRCGVSEMGTLDSVKVDLSTGFVLCSAFWAPKIKTQNETQVWRSWHLIFFFLFLFEGSAISFIKIAEYQPLDTRFRSCVKGLAPLKRLGRFGLATCGAWMCCAHALSGKVVVELPLLSTDPFSLAPVYAPINDPSSLNMDWSPSPYSTKLSALSVGCMFLFRDRRLPLRGFSSLSLENKTRLHKV